LALTADGAQLLTGDEAGHTTLWDLASANPVWQVGAQDAAGKPGNTTGSINAVVISPRAGESVALTVDSEQHIVRLLDLKTGRELLVPSSDGDVDHFLSLRAKDALGWSAAFSPDGLHVATVGGDEARLWDRPGVEVASFGPHRPLTFIALSADDKIIATAGWDNTTRLWNAQTGAALMTLDENVAGEPGAHTAVINSADISPDGTHVLTAADDGTLRVWNAQTGAVQAVIRSPYGGVTRAYYLRDGRRIVAAFRGDAAGAIAGIWSLDGLTGNVDLPAPLTKFAGHTAPVLDIALSPDERFLATGSADNSARVWNTATGRQVLTLEGHSGEVSAVAFSPDRARPRVLTGAADRTAKLWDVSTILIADGNNSTAAKELLTLRGHTRGLTSASFSPDGQTALTTSRDGLSILWAADSWKPRSP
jgi:WD40 repeat protein